MANLSGINPIEYNVLVKVIEVEETSKGGIILADTTKARKQAMATRAELVAKSPFAFSYERWPEDEAPPEPGQMVIITKAAGVEVEGLDGEIYRMLKDKDVGAVIGGFDARLAELDREIKTLNKEAANV